MSSNENDDNSDYLDVQIVNMLYTFFMVISRFLYNIFHNLNLRNYNVVHSLPKSPHVLYIENEKQRFAKLFDTIDNSQLNTNSNITSVFYTLEEYNKIVANENSDLEKLWRTRILFENTPAGNVAMFYDVYKRGFAYVSDTSFINNDILNAIAMKYVRIYKCRDLFIDEYLSPECSPIVKLLEEEEKAENNKKLQKMKENNIDISKLKSSSFAKFKKYDTSSTTTTEQSGLSDKITPPKKERPLYRNKYIYSGKLRDFKLLQSRPKPKPRVTFTNSRFTSIFEQEHSLQNNVLERKNLNYKDFKKNISGHTFTPITTTPITLAM